MRNMKRSVSLALVVVLVLSMLTFLPTVLAAETNLISNGTFNGNLNGWNISWSGNNDEFIYDSEASHTNDGTGAAKAVAGGYANNGLYIYNMAVEKDATYEFTYYGYSATNSPAYADIGNMGVDEGSYGSASLSANAKTWEKGTITFKANTNNLVIRCVVAGLTDGYVLFDDVSLVKKTGASSGGSDGFNGTFDSDISGWVGDAAYFKWTDDNYKTAAGALSVNTEEAKTTRVISATLPVAAGKQYSVSYWGYKDTAAATYLDVHDGDVDNNQLIQLGIDNPGSWQNPGAVITPTQDKIRIRIVVDNYSSGNFYVDDIKFEEYEAPGVLGDNLFIGGDIEPSVLTNLWFRTDWNGGTWEAKDGVGKGGSKGLTAVSVVDNPGGEYNIGLYYSTLGQQPGPLKLEAGKTYELGFDVYRGAGVDSAVYMDDEGGNATNVSATKNGEWESVSGRFVATSADYNFRLVCNALSRGEEVYVDNMYLREVGTESEITDVPNNSLAQNGSFENGRGTSAAGWKQTSVWNRCTKDTVSVNGKEITITPHDGDYMMKATATSTAICMGDEIAVKPNTYYTYSGYMYRTDSQGTAYLNLLDYKTNDIAGTQIGTDTTGKWIRVSYTFFSGEHTAIHPRMVIDGTADAQPTGNPVYFDDIQVKELVYEGSKAFPEGVPLENVKAEYELSTATTAASFALTEDGLYITSLALNGAAEKYLQEAIAAPLTSVINETAVAWKYESSELVDIEKGKELHAIFKSEDGKYKIEAVWTAREGVGPLEYNQYLTGINSGISVSYDEVVSANFKVKADGDATLYRFSRSRVNDGSDPYFAKGTLDTELEANQMVISSVENGYSPVASILPFQMIDIDGDHGVYFGHYWSFGKLLVRANEKNEVAITTYLSDDASATIERAAGKVLNIPGFFIGTYEGDIDDGSNDMKNWFWEYKITRSLYENENEPHLEMGDIGITSEKMQTNLFDTWPDIANYLDVIKIDYIWTLPDDTNPRVDKVQEDTWLPNATRYYDSEKGKVYFGVYETIKNYAANDGIDNELYLSLYMADTYLGLDIATQEGREAQLQALKDRFEPQNNDYGIGYDYWRSDFVVENSFNYDSHEGLLYILDGMIEYSDGFRYEHCSGAGSLKDFTTLERMAFMTTEDTARPLNHRMSLYANTYMISPTQLKADLNMTYNERDYGALTGYGPIIGYGPDGEAIDVWTDKEYTIYTLRTSMLGASMVCFNKEGLEMNLDIIKEHYQLYNDTHRAILRDCNVYHILEAPTGWEWNDWDGIMYYNENIDKGTVQLFKENASAPDDKTITLKGLDADTLYKLTFIDRTEQNCLMLGKDLMTTGLRVTGMTQRYDSEIIYIEPYTALLVDGVAVSGKTEMKVDETQQLKAIVTPANADNKEVTWTSANEAIATVDKDGNVTAISEGEVSIIATAKDDSKKSGSITIKVTKPTEKVLVESIEVSGKTSMEVGEKQTLKVWYTPENATTKGVVWAISDDTIARVDENGVVTALKEGEVEVTAISIDSIDTQDINNWVSDSITIKVTAPKESVVEPDDKIPGTDAKTGDASNILLWVIIAIAALGAVAAAIIILNKRKKNDDEE